MRWNEELLVEQQGLQVPHGVREGSRQPNKRDSEESFARTRENAQFQGGKAHQAVFQIRITKKVFFFFLTLDWTLIHPSY